MADLREWLRLAMGATPGDWREVPEEVAGWHSVVSGEIVVAEFNRFEDASFIAASNPSRVKEICLRLLRVEEALREISKIGYGLDGTETDEYLADYWAALALSFQRIARAALEEKKE